jgi:hypothetical protein
MPSGELIGTTLKLTTGRKVTDGHSHFPTQRSAERTTEARRWYYMDFGFMQAST